jgi:hypothetical protein
MKELKLSANPWTEPRVKKAFVKAEGGARFVKEALKFIEKHYKQAAAKSGGKKGKKGKGGDGGGDKAAAPVVDEAAAAERKARQAAITAAKEEEARAQRAEKQKVRGATVAISCCAFTSCNRGHVTRHFVLRLSAYTNLTLYYDSAM